MTASIVNTFNWLGLARRWNSFKETYRKNKAYRETVNALEKLTDAELRDIGITRGDIRSIAMETHFDNRGAV
jgi:uncharacterized protein YjiS (DUF1127 family)